MFAFRITLNLCFLLCILTGTQSNRRTPRSILSLAKMVQSVQKKVGATTLASYGNWCGPGGSDEPMDAIDNCCRLHDGCYEAVTKSGLCKSIQSVYMIHYRWCLVRGNITCNLANMPCSFASCECDRNFAECLVANLKSYNPRNRMKRVLDFSFLFTSEEK